MLNTDRGFTCYEAHWLADTGACRAGTASHQHTFEGHLTPGVLFISWLWRCLSSQLGASKMTLALFVGSEEGLAKTPQDCSVADLQE